MSKEEFRPSFWRPFLSFPYFDEEFWSIDNTNDSGLSISEDVKNVYVEANLPGLKSEDIELSFEKGMLLIKGSRKEEQKDKEKKYYKKATSSYYYRVSIPALVDENKEPEATYKDGIIKIVFSKKHAASTKAKKIPVKNK
jgi:HSP20 family protein